jgi:hypothetical protein
MNWSDHDKLWNHVFVKVMDVRRMLMEQGETLRSFICLRTPSFIS